MPETPARLPISTNIGITSRLKFDAASKASPARFEYAIFHPRAHACSGVHSDEDELVGVCNRRPDEPDAQHRECDRHSQCQQGKQGQEPDQATKRHADHSGSLPTFSLTISLERTSCQTSSRSIAA